MSAPFRFHDPDHTRARRARRWLASAVRRLAAALRGTMERLAAVIEPVPVCGCHYRRSCALHDTTIDLQTGNAWRDGWGPKPNDPRDWRWPETTR